MNMTQREAVLTLYLVGGTLGLVAIFVTQASILEGYIAGALVALTALYSLWYLERDWIKKERQQSGESDENSSAEQL
jgi:UDP-GlcNAc:undecaprenyl-phosphate GlcNAc-1-phosphate transferase